MNIPIEITEKKLIPNHDGVGDKRGGYPDFSFPVIDKSKQKSRQRDDGTTYTRSEPIDLDNIKENKYEDDGYDKDSDDLKEKLYPKQLVPRRPAFKFTEINCSGCNKQFSVHPMHVRGTGNDRYYYCDKCISKRKPR